MSIRRKRAFCAVGSVLTALAVGLGLGARPALAGGLPSSGSPSPGSPSPGSPGPLFSPAFSSSLFADPTAALRPKYRWWQPVADTNDGQIRAEVKNMAADGGGGFEQNGFPVNMNSGGTTTQFLTYANSQQFGQASGWGSPLWSNRTQTYQGAAAHDGVIGDMNEGSRWNNTVPAVYSENQPAAAKDLVYGDAQFQPGTNPSGELPPATTAIPGVSTTLTSPARPGDGNLQLGSVAGLLAGDKITLGTGPDAETATIKNVGTASPAVALSQAAAKGSTVVHVPPATTSTTGATTGVPGTGMLPAQFVAGNQVTIGSGADRETGTIKSVGTYDMTERDLVPYTGSSPADWIWNTANSASSAAVGTVYLRKTFTTPPGVTGARLRINADNSHVTYVNGKQVASGGDWTTSQNVDITKDLNAAGQQNVIAVAATNEGASPNPAGVIAAVQIDGSSPGMIVTDRSWKAWPASAANPPVSATPPASNWNTAGFDDSAWENAFSAGAFGSSPWGSPGTGGPTTLVLPPGGSGTVAAPAGATNVEVASTSNFLKGDTITIGTGGQAEQRTITSVGAAGNGTTLPAAAASGDLQISVASAAGLSAGQFITIGNGSSQETDRIATVSGTTLTLYTPLRSAHAPGDPVALKSIGVTFSPALSHSHSVGDNAADTGTGITLTSPLAYTHPSGDTFMAPGTGVTLTAPLTKAHAADVNAAPQTTIAAAADAGATNLKVASVEGLAAGDTITVGSPGYSETATIQAVGTAGAAGTGLTLASGLKLPHFFNDPVADASSPASNASAGLSDIAKKQLIAVEFAQCTSSSASSCPSAATGGTRSLDPSSVQVVTGQASNGSLTYTSNGGVLPEGNGNPWEEIVFYQTADGQVLNGTSSTTPNYWLDHLSLTGAQAMADYFDNHILNNPATAAAIKYQDQHTGTPAVFEDSLEDSNNLKWTPGMLGQWKSDLGYDPTNLLAAIAGENKNATSAPAFDFPQSDGQGATLGWRIREDYRQMWNDLYTGQYEPALDKWASSHGLVARFQSYGDPIDEGAASAQAGIAEGEHLEFTNRDETQQFKVIASGTYQNGNKVVSDECCEESGDAWADTFGVDGTGSGPEGSPILSNANSAYADIAGGDTQIVWHGWPYTIGAAGRSAVWPGNTYGGDTSYSAANGPNQPQVADDAQANTDLARIALAMRQGQPSFDVAVYHQDLGLDGQGADTLANGENLGTPGVTTGKLIRSSSALAQDGYTYGYVSPVFFSYPSATYGNAPGQSDGGPGGKVLFPGHGDYKSLVIYDQSVMPAAAAEKILSLATQGLPVLIIGQVPDAVASAAPGTVSGMAAQDAKVQAAMKALTALPNVKVVPDSTVSGSQSSDGNAPAALRSLGIAPATGLSGGTASSSGTATPVLTERRSAGGTDYYYLYNPNMTTTVDPTVTLAGQGAPYQLDTWTGKITPIADYQQDSADGGSVSLQVRLSPGNFKLIAVSTTDLAQQTAPGLHATSTTANATPASADNVVYGESGQLEARASSSGTYTTTLSNGKSVTSNITVPVIGPGSGPVTLSSWQLSVDSWGPTPSGDPTQTAHTQIPAAGTITVKPLAGTTDGSLPSWTQITPHNGYPAADNLTNAAGIGTYTTSVSLPSNWSPSSDGAYLNVGVAVDTVDIWVNGTRVQGVDQNDRNQVDLGPYLRAGANTIKITTATPLRNAVAVASAVPATGQVPDDADPIGQLQGGTKEANMGLIGPVTLTPYGQATLPAGS